MRSPLFYLRSVKFKLRSPSRAAEIDILVSVTDSGVLECQFDDHGKEVCTCVFLRCARDVGRGIIGMREDPPLVRFLKAWDMSPPSERNAAYLYCGFCGKNCYHVSLRRDRQEGNESDSDSDVCEENVESGSWR